MTPQVMRQFWSIVENAHSQTLLQMDDNNLVCWLVNQTTMRGLLNVNETDFLSEYIKSRLHLIRDIVCENQYS